MILWLYIFLLSLTAVLRLIDYKVRETSCILYNVLYCTVLYQIFLKYTVYEISSLDKRLWTGKAISVKKMKKMSGILRQWPLSFLKITFNSYRPPSFTDWSTARGEWIIPFRKICTENFYSKIFAHTHEIILLYKPLSHYK